MVKLKLIPPEEIVNIWANIAAWVESSLGIDKSYSVDDVKKACQSGKISLWVIYLNDQSTGFLTTIINEAPQGLTCYCPWLGGESLDKWVSEGFEQLKIILKEKGCLSLSWMGRAAWKKLINVSSTQCFYLINL